MGPMCKLHQGIKLLEREAGEDYRWWTGAITIKEKPWGASPTSSMNWKGKVHSRQHQRSQPGKWVPKHQTTTVSCTVDGEKNDADVEQFGVIRTSSYQIWDETEEIPSSTKNEGRRW